MTSRCDLNASNTNGLEMFWNVYLCIIPKASETHDYKLKTINTLTSGLVMLVDSAVYFRQKENW